MSNPGAPDTPRQGCANTFHEPGKRLGAGGRNGQRELVDCDPVGHGEPVDAPVGDLPGEQLPQQHSVAGKQSFPQVKGKGGRVSSRDTLAGQTPQRPPPAPDGALLLQQRARRPLPAGSGDSSSPRRPRPSWEPVGSRSATVVTSTLLLLARFPRLPETSGVGEDMRFQPHRCVVLHTAGLGPDRADRSCRCPPSVC